MLESLRASISAAPRSRRGRIGIAAAAVAVVLAIVLPLTLASGPAAPDTASARLVPADALLYVTESTDPGRDGVRRAQALTRRFPALARLPGALLRQASVPADFDRDVRPWLGHEAALALVDAAGRPAPVALLAVAHREGAERFVAGLGSGTTTTYSGARVVHAGGVTAAFVGDYLAVGDDAGVRRAIDVARHRALPLADAGDYEHATATLPVDRAVGGWASSAGVRRVLARPDGPLGGVGALLDQPGLTGSALALTAVAQGAQVTAHNERRPAGPGALQSFTPTLAANVPADTTAFLDVAGLSHAAPRLLAGPRTGAGGVLGGALGRVQAFLARRAPIDFERDLLSQLSGETALSLAAGRPPTLTLVSRVRDEARARTTLAQLQGPLAQALAPASAGSGQQPTFSEQRVAGVTAYALRLTPTLSLDYAVFDGRIAVSTSLAGIAAARRPDRSLGDSPKFAQVVPGGSGPATSIGYVDLAQFLGLADQTSLAHDPRYAAVRADLQRIRAVGLRSSRGAADSTVELNFLIP